MKLAAYLALALALSLGAWSAHDYYQNEQRKQMVVFELEVTSLGHNTAALGAQAHKALKEILADERYDGVMGIFAGAFLIGSVVLFSKAKAPQAAGPASP